MRHGLILQVPAEALGSVECVLILAIVALVGITLYDLFPGWRS